MILKKFLNRKKKKQTTFCYCPNCNYELIGNKCFVSDYNLVTYKCKQCECISMWQFDTPVPILTKYT